jgi:dienelactone hydrolase
VVLTDSLQVSGFFLRPPEPPPWDAPDYVNEDAFHEVEVTVGSDPWILPGVLTVPEGNGPFPGAVLVHGSGPNDRDETIGGTRPFKDLAWGLASRGIAVLRYDKRTKVHGSRMSPDVDLDDEVVLDALSALDVARDRAEIDEARMFLVGHSLGGIMGPAIASRDGRLAGLVLLAAPARPFFEVLKDQLSYLAGLEPDSQAPARMQLDSMIDLVSSLEVGAVPEGQTILGAPPAYWREVAGVDPVAAARELSTPLLVLQGGRDYQSTTMDFQVWENALGGRKDVTLRLYPALNHLFVRGTGMAKPEEYTTGRGHVAGEVVEDLAAWIQEMGGS